MESRTRGSAQTRTRDASPSSEMIGRLATPDGEGKHPALLIAHEGGGLDDYQKSRADLFASLGYVACGHQRRRRAAVRGQQRSRARYLPATSVVGRDDGGRVGGRGRRRA